MPSKSKRFDERDNVQARGAFKPGSADYKKYYNQHPEPEEKDGRARGLSEKYTGNTNDFLFFILLTENLGRMGMENIVDGPVAHVKQKFMPERAAGKLKGYAKFFGADLVRIGIK